jgi:hypothetical protein
MHQLLSHDRLRETWYFQTWQTVRYVGTLSGSRKKVVNNAEDDTLPAGQGRSWLEFLEDFADDDTDDDDCSYRIRDTNDSYKFF